MVLFYFTCGALIRKLEFGFFIALGFALVIIGVIIIILAVIVASSRGTGKGKAKAAGVVMIGPIPIIFGTDKKSIKEILVLALALTIALIILYYLLWR